MKHLNAEGKQIYHKICRHCRKPFESTSRRQAYCTPEHQKAHAVKVKTRRKEYHENHDYNYMVGRAYQLGRMLAEEFLKDEKEALEKQFPGELIELHHWNCCPLNNDLNNLQWLTRKQHEAVHSRLPPDDVVKQIKEYETADKDFKKLRLAALLEKPVRNKQEVVDA